MESLSEKGRSLHDYLAESDHFSPMISLQITRQILFALREMHTAAHPYVHLDIQDANIFLQGTLGEDSELITLIDFGSAKPLHHESKRMETEPLDIRFLFSTEGFTAPEILNCCTGEVVLTPAADLFSVGCLLYLFLTGSRLTGRDVKRNAGTGSTLSGKDLRRLRKEGFPGYLEDKMQEILSRALNPDSEDRYQSADEMLDDIRLVLERLSEQNRENALSVVSYDAFICYRHSDLDTAAALRIQKNLES